MLDKRSSMAFFDELQSCGNNNSELAWIAKMAGKNLNLRNSKKIFSKIAIAIDRRLYQKAEITAELQLLECYKKNDEG